jgi:hypothetical protein
MNMWPLCVWNDRDVAVILTRDRCPVEIDALSDLSGLEVEGEDDSIWYIMGTDAWGDWEEVDGEMYLVYRSPERVFFRCHFPLAGYDRLAADEGFLLVTCEVALDEDELRTVFGTPRPFEDVEAWLRQQAGESELDDDSGLWCVIGAAYTDEQKREYFVLDESGNIVELR